MTSCSFALAALTASPLVSRIGMPSGSPSPHEGRPPSQIISGVVEPPDHAPSFIIVPEFAEPLPSDVMVKCPFLCEYVGTGDMLNCPRVGAVRVLDVVLRGTEIPLQHQSAMLNADVHSRNHLWLRCDLLVRQEDVHGICLEALHTMDERDVIGVEEVVLTNKQMYISPREELSPLFPCKSGDVQKGSVPAVEDVRVIRFRVLYSPDNTPIRREPVPDASFPGFSTANGCIQLPQRAFDGVKVIRRYTEKALNARAALPHRSKSFTTFLPRAEWEFITGWLRRRGGERVLKRCSPRRRDWYHQTLDTSATRENVPIERLKFNSPGMTLVRRLFGKLFGFGARRHLRPKLSRRWKQGDEVPREVLRLHDTVYVTGLGDLGGQLRFLYDTEMCELKTTLTPEKIILSEDAVSQRIMAHCDRELPRLGRFGGVKPGRKFWYEHNGQEMLFAVSEIDYANGRVHGSTPFGILCNVSLEVAEEGIKKVST